MTTYELLLCYWDDFFFFFLQKETSIFPSGYLTAGDGANCINKKQDDGANENSTDIDKRLLFIFTCTRGIKGGSAG